VKQSRWMSFVEAFFNISVGYALAIIVQIVVFPMYDMHINTQAHLEIGGIFLIVSLIRSYGLRRLFEAFRNWKVRRWIWENLSR